MIAHVGRSYVVGKREKSRHFRSGERDELLELIASRGEALFE
jgi:hypothetical protein